MRIKNVKIYGLEESIMRSGYPMQIGEPDSLIEASPVEKDYDRAYKLANSPISSGHNNFLKGIIVQFDLQYPEYFSPQLQRYHWVDIVSSQSKMHRITSRELTREDFTGYVLGGTIESLNAWIECYNKEKDEETRQKYFQSIISNLPSGYLKWMGISTNYLQLKTIYKQRRHHKLPQWQYFCNWIETLPLAEKLIK